MTVRVPGFFTAPDFTAQLAAPSARSNTSVSIDPISDLSKSVRVKLAAAEARSTPGVSREKTNSARAIIFIRCISVLDAVPNGGFQDNSQICNKQTERMTGKAGVRAALPVELI